MTDTPDFIIENEKQTEMYTGNQLVEYLPLGVHRRAAKRGGAQEAPTRSHHSTDSSIITHRSHRVRLETWTA
jgi:hypothetical protein